MSVVLFLVAFGMVVAGLFDFARRELQEQEWRRLGRTLDHCRWTPEKGEADALAGRWES